MYTYTVTSYNSIVGMGGFAVITRNTLFNISA